MTQTGEMKFLTMGEVAERLRVSETTSYRLCWDRQLKSVKVRGRRLVPCDSFAAYLRKIAK